MYRRAQFRAGPLCGLALFVVLLVLVARPWTPQRGPNGAWASPLSPLLGGELASPLPADAATETGALGWRVPLGIGALGLGLLLVVSGVGYLIKQR